MIFLFGTDSFEHSREKERGTYPWLRLLRRLRPPLPRRRLRRRRLRRRRSPARSPRSPPRPLRRLRRSARRRPPETTHAPRRRALGWAPRRGRAVAQRAAEFNSRRMPCAPPAFFVGFFVLAPVGRRSRQRQNGRARGPRQTRRSTISFLSSAMALAGESPLGHALAQFMIVWQR